MSDSAFVLLIAAALFTQAVLYGALAYVALHATAAIR